MGLQEITTDYTVINRIRQVIKTHESVFKNPQLRNSNDHYISEYLKVAKNTLDKINKSHYGRINGVSDLAKDASFFVKICICKNTTQFDFSDIVLVEMQIQLLCNFNEKLRQSVAIKDPTSGSTIYIRCKDVRKLSGAEYRPYFLHNDLIEYLIEEHKEIINANSLLKIPALYKPLSAFKKSVRIIMLQILLKKHRYIPKDHEALVAAIIFSFRSSHEMNDVIEKSGNAKLLAKIISTQLSNEIKSTMKQYLPYSNSIFSNTAQTTKY